MIQKSTDGGNTLSLPTQERGLKFLDPVRADIVLESLPTRERRGEITNQIRYLKIIWSFPVRQMWVKIAKNIL